jgi:membrane protease YdiL (CAAX protease family)
VEEVNRRVLRFLAAEITRCHRRGSEDEQGGEVLARLETGGGYDMARKLFGGWLLTLYGGWIVAWFFFQALETKFPELKEPLVATAWWTLAKLIIWIAPVFVLSRFIPLAPGALRLGHLKRVPFALLVSVAWIALNAAGDALLNRTPAPTLNAAVISGCLVAPFAEELLFRGFAFAWLEQLGVGFWKTNTLCAVLFALLHLPGWGMMEGLSLGLLGHLAQTAALGFGFGLLRKGDASLWAPISLHFANNAWSQGLISWLVSAAD